MTNTQKSTKKSTKDSTKPTSRDSENKSTEETPVDNSEGKTLRSPPSFKELEKKPPHPERADEEIYDRDDLVTRREYFRLSQGRRDELAEIYRELITKGVKDYQTKPKAEKSLTKEQIKHLHHCID